MVSDERALATNLAAADDADLARTLAARQVSPSIGWLDFFDAAEGLLDAASVDRALTRLSRSRLIALATAADDGPADDVARQLALVAHDGAPYRAVAARIRAVADANPSAFEPEPDHPIADAADGSACAVAAERAFTTVGALADLLLAGIHAPLALTGAGTVSAADRRRLIDIGAIGSADEVDDLAIAATEAGLMVVDDRELTTTAAGAAWLEASSAARWTSVVESFRNALPQGLRTADGGFAPASSWSNAYPLDPDWPERAARLRRTAEHWGLLTESGAEPAWTSSLRSGEPADATALAAHLPAEIDRVYLQADLTAIAPGPLAPPLDLRLRGIAHRESRAQASTYRFSAESLGAGMTDGETGDSIRAFLSDLSLTGIPQPLEYLIESTAARHGLVRVRADAASGRTRVETADTAVRETILVDQALRPLGFVRDGDTLASRVARDPVYWALADARYPVVALDETGTPEPLARRSAATSPNTTPSSPAEVYARLIATLRASHDDDADAAWLGRELDQAVRSRAVIMVDVRMPDGTERSFTLEASGLGGGRLRGRDRAADIERTLPVASIMRVHLTG